MNFRTKLNPPPSPLQIGYGDRILSMGSCFADRIGEKLTQAKLPSLVNPLGISYNPLSLGHLLAVVCGWTEISAPVFSEKEEVWQSFDLHSRFNHPSKETYERQTHEAIQLTREWLSQTDLLILTFGTAFGFRRKDNGRIVNNCHRFPASFFERELLSHTLLEEQVSSLFHQLLSAYPELRILLTVSPVRHIKDTLPLNAVSKATLRILCHQVTESFSQVFYFPSYELLLDDLRDYRFYQEDLIHPSAFAETYIWEKFVETHLNSHAQHLLTQWGQIRRDLQHRPRQAQSEAHQRFLRALLRKLNEVAGDIDCQEEIEAVRQQIIG